jgi:lipid II:glycine glycyltransferase (peptidoglycan interpeptide bridge formation enzyme)
MSMTGERDAFRIHDKKHYKNMLGASENIKLFFATYEGKNIAAGLFCFFGNRVTYMHGASDNEARNLMAPYLLQWEIIKRAKKEAYKYYDFYGIDEKKWPGVTRFKVGFGGFVKEYPGTYDFIFRPAIYNFYEQLRKLKRSFK